MTTTETIEERMERVKAAALANGVKFLSEEELQHRNIQRFDHRQNCRSGSKARTPQRSVPTTARMPYKDPVDADDPRSPREAGRSAQRTVPTSGADKQREFVARGEGESANKALSAFFWKELESGGRDKWRARTFLKEICLNDLVNNRAIDIRPEFEKAGFYIDQSSDPALTGGHGSHYRVCSIEDAVSLSKAEKFKLINGYEMPPENQTEMKTE